MRLPNGNGKNLVHYIANHHASDFLICHHTCRLPTGTLHSTARSSSLVLELLSTLPSRGPWDPRGLQLQRNPAASALT